MLLGRGKTVADIANREGSRRSIKAAYSRIYALRKLLDMETTQQVTVFAAAYIESGLEREINDDFMPYRFADKQ